MDRVLFDDLGFGLEADQPPPSTGSVPEPPAQEVPQSPEPAPPPPPREKRRSDTPGTDLLPKAYKDWRPKRPVTGARTAAKPVMFDDLGFGGEAEPAAAGSRYDPDDDWALWRGVKAGFEGSADAMADAAEMARVATLPADQQVAAMLEREAGDPYATQLQ